MPVSVPSAVVSVGRAGERKAGRDGDALERRPPVVLIETVDGAAQRQAGNRGRQRSGCRAGDREGAVGVDLEVAVTELPLALPVIEAALPVPVAEKLASR